MTEQWREKLAGTPSDLRQLDSPAACTAQCAQCGSLYRVWQKIYAILRAGGKWVLGLLLHNGYSHGQQRWTASAASSACQHFRSPPRCLVPPCLPPDSHCSANQGAEL